MSSGPLCPECNQGKCANCTGEAMEGETLVACQCLGITHLTGMEQEVYRLIEGSAVVGATVHEIHGITGIKKPADQLGVLLHRGHIVSRGDARLGWTVYVSHLDAASPQIGAQSVGDKQEGTDMSDETDEDNVRQLREQSIEQMAEGMEVPLGPVLRVDDIQPFARRASALERAKGILGEETTAANLGGRQGNIRPKVDDLLRLAVYIDTGVLLSDALVRRFGSDD